MSEVLLTVQHNQPLFAGGFNESTMQNIPTLIPNTLCCSPWAWEGTGVSVPERDVCPREGCLSRRGISVPERDGHAQGHWSSRCRAAGAAQLSQEGVMGGGRKDTQLGHSSLTRA